ncbi:MAG TPA: FAD-linked oxidase C-terminal domain-containing protein, partial [Polyangiaceae bacterium]|nr:FAD-linked oxidase C-terminal domain-containing protein [Polyangiaceae bacterium]
LVVGSEGVFGIVTSAELRLWPAPAARTFASMSFASVEAGCDAIRDMFQAGLRPAVCRLYDAFDSWMAKRGAVTGKKKSASSASSRALKNAAVRWVLRAPRALNGLVDAIGDRAFGGVTLILVFEGEASHGQSDVERAKHIARRHGATDLGEAPARHWLEHRYAVSYRQSPVFMSGAFSDTMEVAAPWSRLVPMYHAVRRAISGRVFVMAHFSHAYPDGASIYFTFAGSAGDRASSEALYDSTWQDALDAAIDAGGTLSHHHGVGRSKAPKLGRELGLGVDVIHALRGVFDPAGIFNPGNLVPRERGKKAIDIDSVPPDRAPRFDDASLLVHASGKTPLGLVEEEARAHGLTLSIEGLDASEPVASYLARGAPGAPDPWSDPVDHVVAGFRAKLAEGGELVVRPGPRRAVGPDLYALFHGMHGRVGDIVSAHLRTHRVGLSSRPAPSTIERDPSLSSDEATWVERVAETARRVGG